MTQKATSEATSLGVGFVWYVIEAKCMKDGLAARKLRAWCAPMGLRVWRPIERIRIGRGSSRRTILRSRMPGYLLLRMPWGALDDVMWQQVKGTDGVNRWLVSRPGEAPRAIPDRIIRNVRLAMIAKRITNKKLVSEGFSTGERVLVINRLIADTYGEAIARIVSVDNNKRARIMLDYTGVAVPMTIKTADLRKLTAQAA